MLLAKLVLFLPGFLFAVPLPVSQVPSKERLKCRNMLEAKQGLPGAQDRKLSSREKN